MRVLVALHGAPASISEGGNHAPSQDHQGQTHDGHRPSQHGDARPVGLVTLNRASEIAPQDRATTTLGDIMFPMSEVVTAAPDEPLAHLLLRLETSPAHRALVLDQGKLVGIVPASDINRVLTWLTSAPRGGHT
jgi:CBS-domain-containing membrane protein